MKSSLGKDFIFITINLLPVRNQIVLVLNTQLEQNTLNGNYNKFCYFLFSLKRISSCESRVSIKIITKPIISHFISSLIKEVLCKTITVLHPVRTTFNY